MTLVRRPDAYHRLGDVAVAALVVAVATSTWNAVEIGPLTLSQWFLAAAAAGLGVRAVALDEVVRVPWWIWPLGGALAVVAAAAFVLPPDPAAEALRYAGQNLGVPRVVTSDPGALAVSNLLSGVQWSVAAVLLPILVCIGVRDRPELVRRLADGWVAGATVNAAVAVADESGLTRISARFLTIVDAGGRQAGLTVQPNHAAIAVALALPLSIWRCARPSSGRTRVLFGGALAVMVAGLGATGSRGGLVAAGLGAVAVLVTDARVRRIVPWVGMVCVAAGAVVVTAAPSLVTALGSALRLDGSGGADESDAIRVTLASQALQDIDRSPFLGIGLHVTDEAHNVFLQVLASGGVVLFVGYVVTQTGFLAGAWSGRRRYDGLPGAVAISGAVVLVVGLVANTLTDVFVHVPLALGAGLWATDRAAADHRPSHMREEMHS